MAEKNSVHYASEKDARRYHEFWKTVSFNEASLKSGRERFNRFMGLVKQGGTVLDAGCGTGLLDSHLTSRGFSVTGIDSSSHMLKIAASENPTCRYRQMNITALDFPDNSFDGIINTGVIVHVPGQLITVVFQEFQRVLRHNGAIWISTRTATSDRHGVETASEGGEMEVFYYSPETLNNELKRAQFTTVWQSVEPDDSGRPFDYMHIICRKN